MMSSCVGLASSPRSRSLRQTSHAVCDRSVPGHTPTYIAIKRGDHNGVQQAAATHDGDALGANGGELGPEECTEPGTVSRAKASPKACRATCR